MTRQSKQEWYKFCTALSLAFFGAGLITGNDWVSTTALVLLILFGIKLLSLSTDQQDQDQPESE